MAHATEASLSKDLRFAAISLGTWACSSPGMQQQYAHPQAAVLPGSERIPFESSLSLSGHDAYELWRLDGSDDSATATASPAC